jgi:hypothetical protein
MRTTRAVPFPGAVLALDGGETVRVPNDMLLGTIVTVHPGPGSDG